MGSKTNEGKETKMSKQTKKTKQAEAAQVIGAVTTYLGNDYGMKPGHKVKIIAVLPKDEDAYIRDDDELARRGGVKASDRVEIAPWIEKEGRFSWVSNDPMSTELEAFKKLRK